MEQPRTYRWYITNIFDIGSDHYFTSDPSHKTCNAGSGNDHIDNFTKIGLIDQTPTIENFVPLIEKYHAWWETVQIDWSNYTREEKVRGLLWTLHWTLTNVMSDPTLDHNILREISRRFGKKFNDKIIENFGCPPDLVLELLKTVTKEEKDWRAKFAVHNKGLKPEALDHIARTTKLGKVQQSVVRHPNVSKETLVFISEHGRSESVRKSALFTLHEKGLLTVK